MALGDVDAASALAASCATRPGVVLPALALGVLLVELMLAEDFFGVRLGAAETSLSSPLAPRAKSRRVV